MTWLKSNMVRQVEELTCTLCGYKVTGDEVRLTRYSQVAQPPDILFTTTEMLNQHLSNNFQNLLFGVGSHIKAPPLVLLDEIHTYGGNTGAQTAFLLQRWMQRSWCRPHFVGLSATLTDAEAFFSQLIGTDPSRVELIEPKQDEIEDQGAEYLLALRGDPVSQTALLSTTIQASMLTRRILDPLQGGKSQGTWGSKTFIFTDDLDVTNRLYFQLSDAEGWEVVNNRLRPNRAPLAHLREPDYQQRKIDLGQNWRVSHDIGHPLSLDDRSRVARTSSQDAGVDSQSDMIIATASLEVGFNDPLVGAVIQHKAPRDVSSYIQRKGRAGRPTLMRPWMLVVLSEFGRDRVAFQRYEDLINPEIKRQGLPLKNSHIQKMQAAMATLDWMSTQMGQVSIWSMLRAPIKNEFACNQLLILIKDLLSQGELRDKYLTYLEWALGLDETSIQKVLWSPPRSVMLEFLPTLYRLLSTQWREQGKEWEAVSRNRSPLPQFIPDALFSALNQPSLDVALQRNRNIEIQWESINYYQGLRDFAPGRISKRFAVRSNYEADWVIPTDFQPVPDTFMRVPFEVTEAFGPRMIFEGEVETISGETLKILRPIEIYTHHLPRNTNLTEKSNSLIQWHVDFKATNDGALEHGSPKGSWQGSLIDSTFYTHSQMTPLEVTRYATGALASLRFNGGAASHIQFDWQLEGQSIGVGDRQWVDGARFRFKISDHILNDLKHDSLILSAIRPVYFRYCVAQLEHFENDPFTANWVVECFLAVIANELGDDGFAQNYDSVTRIRECLSKLQSKEGRQKLLTIPLSLFQPDEQQAAEEHGLRERLRHLLANYELLQQIESCEDVLWEEPDKISGLDEWLRIVMANTLAGAAQQMLCVLLPDVEEDSVHADALWKDDVLEVWITETEGGGSGVINRLGQTYLEDPVYLLNIFVRCLQPSDYEQIDSDLFNLLEMLEQDGDLRSQLDAVRLSRDYKTRRQAIDHLLKTLQENGFALSHSFCSVLFSRVIRPGSNQGSDALLLTLLRKWKAIERNSALEWGLNIASHTLASQSFIEKPSSNELFNRFCLYQGLLWPRGYEIRQSELGYYNRFQNGQIITERLLAAAIFDDHTPQVICKVDTWLPELHYEINRIGRADLVIERRDFDKISAIIVRIQSEPIEYMGLFLYPRMSGMRRNRGRVLLRIEMAEILQ